MNSPISQALFVILTILFVGGLSVWVFLDAGRRRMRAPGGWALGVLILIVIFLPLYLARRHLRPGEVRRGGAIFNFAKYLTVLWGVNVMLSLPVFLLDVLLFSPAPIAVKANEVGYIFRSSVATWLAVAVPAMALGLLFRRRSVVEEGPTGPMAQAS